MEGQKNGLQSKIRRTSSVSHPLCWVQGRDKGRGKPLPWDCRSGRKVGKGGRKASKPPAPRGLVGFSFSFHIFLGGVFFGRAEGLFAGGSGGVAATPGKLKLLLNVWTYGGMDMR